MARDDDAAGGEGAEEHLAVAAAEDPRVQNDDHPFVLVGADEAPETLLELQDRLGQLVIVERVAARGPDGFDARPRGAGRGRRTAGA